MIIHKWWKKYLGIFNLTAEDAYPPKETIYIDNYINYNSLLKIVDKYKNIYKYSLSSKLQLWSSL